MTLTKIALTAVLALGVLACHKNGPGTDPNGNTAAEAESIGNSAGSYPAGPTAVPNSGGVGATGVTDPIDQPPAPDTPTK